MFREYLSRDAWESLEARVAATVPQIVSGVVIFIAFWLAALLLRSLIRRIAIGHRLDDSLVQLFAKAAYLGLLMFGLVTALGTMGIDVAALVAGLGLTGFALGFALKDVVSNLVAGVLILIFKPFDEGDRVKVAAFEGTVRTIDLRYTVLDGVRETQGQTIYVPNSMLFTNAITVDRRAPETTSEPPPPGL